MDGDNARCHVHIFPFQGDQFPGPHTRIQQEETDGLVPFVLAALKDDGDLTLVERRQDLLLHLGHLYLVEWGALDQFVANAVVEEGAYGAGQVVLVLAGQPTTLNIDQEAPNVVR